MDIIYFQKTGNWHKTQGKACEDALLTLHIPKSDCAEEVTVFALSDGVSTCSQALRGAEITCQTIAQAFYCAGTYLLGLIDCGEKEKFGALLISKIYQVLSQEAREHSLSVEEYASTLSACIYDHHRKRLVLLILGDSMAMIEFTNTEKVLLCGSRTDGTTAVTADPAASGELTLHVYDNIDLIRNVTLMSDGAWRELSKVDERSDPVMLLQQLSHAEANDDISLISVAFCSSAL